MLQRKQSLWLFIAALLNAGVFFFGLYSYHIVENGADTAKMLRVNDHFPSLLIALVMTLLPLIIIFMYNNRKRQISMSFAGILAIISFVSLTLNRVTNLGKLVPPPTNESYWIGAILPVIAMAFVFMAILGIRRDEAGKVSGQIAVIIFF